MNIQFLIPPTDLNSSYGALKDFSNPQPSIGLAYMAAVLRDNGHQVSVTDAYAAQLGLDEILAEVQTKQPDILGISVLTSSAEVTRTIAQAMRQRFPQIKLVLGNVHASLFVDECLSEGDGDVVVHREGEYAMLDLVTAYQNQKPLSEVLGISFIDEQGQIVHNPQREAIRDLDALPYPAWDLFPHEFYSTDPRTEVQKGIVETQLLGTRGCPLPCTFCSSRSERSMGARYRMRSPDSVINEMLYMNEKYGSTVFTFMDLAFPLVKKHAVELCERMIERGVHKRFQWTTECRVRPLDEDLMVLLKEAGCVRLCFGIESGNDQILKDIRKNFTVEDVKRAVYLAKKVGLEADGMFMMGLPNQTQKEIDDTITLATSGPLRYAICNLFVPYPGCDLWDELNAQNKIHFESWGEFPSYPTFSGGKPVFVPDGLDKDALMNLQKKAMRKYYFRPKFILQELGRFKPDMFKKYLSGLLGMLQTFNPSRSKP